MKKSLIALAVAGAFAAPTANAIEFTPTMYQSLALSFGSTDTGATSTDQNTVRTGGGRSIGFKATDDLGNGMTATLFMHYTSDVSEGHNLAVVHRNGYVGLSGGFGSVKMGTNEHIYEVGQIIDGWGADWGVGGDSLTIPTVIGASNTWFTRQDTNSIWWTSPNWGGVTVDAAYILGPDQTTVGTAKKDGEGIQLAVTWASGPIMVQGALADYSEYGAGGLGAFSASNLGTSPADQQGSGTNDFSGMRATVTYDLGVVKLGGTVNMLESEDTAVAGSKTEVTTMAFNATMPVATGRVIFNYAMAGDQDINGQTLPDSGADGFDIGYQHDLSANTYVFARYESMTKAKSYGGAGAATADTDTDAMMVGLKISY
jgi:predicted porin